MKKQGLISVFVLLSVLASAQQHIDSIMRLVPIQVPQYAPPDGFYSVQMPFGKATITKKNLPDVEDLGRLVSVDLVYTSFKRSESFSQPALNRYRLESLRKAMPEIFAQQNVYWNIVEQTAGADKESAAKLFHGFVLNVEAPVGGSDIEYIQEIMNGNTVEAFKDSTVLKVFERRDWDKMLVVADLTGSMSPYVAQVLLWLKLSDKDKKAKHFLFFNDGNLMNDSDKIIGKTGGLYSLPAKDYKSVEALAFRTIRNGNGGDDEENDIEAILAGLKDCPKCENIILIADNDADMRDVELMSGISMPVKVVLCGIKDGIINTQYLDLARATGGSIHTIEGDLMDLVKLNEGGMIEINDKVYQIKDGKFQRMVKG
jgi:hypothetical protein